MAGPSKSRTLRETQALETTADGVNEARTRHLSGVEFVDVHVVGDTLHKLVVRWTDGRLSVVGGHGARGRGDSGGDD